MKCTIDSKALSNVGATPIRRFGLDCQNCAKYILWSIIMPKSNIISFNSRFIFSKASIIEHRDFA